MPDTKDFYCVFSIMGLVFIATTVCAWEIIKFVFKFIVAHVSIIFM